MYILNTNYHNTLKIAISQIYSCSLFINSHCDYISIDMSEDHILIHIMLDDVAVKKMSRQAKNYYSLHNIPKGKFYICQHIWHHWFGLETKFNRTEIHTKYNVFYTYLGIQTSMLPFTHTSKKDMNNERGMHTIVRKMDLDVS